MCICLKNGDKYLVLGILLFLAGAMGPIQAHDGNQKLAGIVLDRDAEQRARDKYRKPVQTLSFFHIESGMRVAEALPGGGWYSQIIAPYLGSEGALYGVNYNDDMWPLFGFFTEERMKAMRDRTEAFPSMVSEFTEQAIESDGFTFATAPEELNGTLDRVLFIRALHNLSRFEEQAKTLSQALQTAHKLLKDDGLVGVVQHRADEASDDSWADGSKGYLKQSAVIDAFEMAGFELLASSELHSNPKDKPAESESVWRLPPTYSGSGEDEAKRQAMMEIGESDRMTLVFKKEGADVHFH